MLQLLKIEYAKVKNYSAFWAISLIYMVLVPLGFYGICTFITELILEALPMKMGMEIFASFPDVFKFLTWTSAWWNFLLGILIVILTCNEISYKTHRQHVIDGMSRSQAIMSKFVFIVSFAAAVALFTAIVGIIFGAAIGGFSGFGGLEYVGIYFIQTLGYFSVAYFVAIVLRRSALAIIVYILLWVANMFFPDGWIIGKFVPTYLISGLIENPFWESFLALAQTQNRTVPEVWYMNMPLRLSLGTLYAVLFFFLGFIIVKRRDL